MNFTHFTPDQKVLIKSIVKKIESSGCSTDECTEVMTEVIGSLLAYMVPSKEELAEYLDSKLLPYIRRVALGWYDVKHIKD